MNLSINPFIFPLIHNKSTFISFSWKCYSCRRDTSATDIFTQFHKIWHTLRNRFWQNDFQLCLLHPQKFNIFCNLRVALKRLCICLLEDYHDKNISLEAIHYLCSNIMNSGYSWLLSLHLHSRPELDASWPEMIATNFSGFMTLMVQYLLSKPG